MRYIVLSVFFLGCAVGPNYRAPVNDVCDSWHTEEVDYCSIMVEWWKQFEDPLLTKYIECSAKYNNNVQAALAKIEEVRGIREVVASKFFPHINSDFNAGRQRFSKNGPIFSLLHPLLNRVLPGILDVISTYNATFPFTWDVDVFGKTRRTVEAATDYIGAAIANKDQVLVTLFAELANSYVELRVFQRLAALVQDNIDLFDQKLKITQKQLEVGYIDKPTYDKVVVDVSLMKAVLPILKAAIQENIYLISVFTGEMPEALLCELSPIAPLPRIPGNIAVGLRSDLLRRRPDVRIAERELAAATAEIGIAVANFFPTITLSGNPGFQATQFNKLFQSSSGIWSIQGDINTPIFEGGKNLGLLRATKAATEAAAYHYQQTVLSALQQAESTLSSYLDSLKTVEELTNSYEGRLDSKNIIQKQYEAGYASLLNFIDAEHQLNYSEQILVVGKLWSLLQLVGLYRSLGGGWEVF